jgi:hypothetical protein
MDNSFHRQESDIQGPRGFLTSLQIVDHILNWLGGLIKLTEEDKIDAGIYLDGQRYK